MSDEFLKDLQKDLNAIKLSEDGLPSDVKDFISTGATLLDYAISNRKNGGIPVGKITEIAGLEGTGKTLLGMQIGANTQKKKGLVIYIDSEHALNSDFAKRVSLNTEKDFIYLTPSTIEEVFKHMFLLFKRIDDAEKQKKSPYDLYTVIWDSIAASPTAEDLNAENPDPTANVGLKPRILSKNLVMLLEQSGRKNVAQVFLNQLRTNIRAQPFSDPYVTTGGKALPFYASARVRLTSANKIKVGEEVVGIQTQAKVVKTRFGPPHRQTAFGIYFNRGVDDTESLIDFLVKNNGIITKAGGAKGKQFSLDGSDYINRDDFKKRILSSSPFKEEIDKRVEELMKKDLTYSSEDEEIGESTEQ